MKHVGWILVGAWAIVSCSNQHPPPRPTGNTDITRARGLEGRAEYWGDRQPARFPAAWPHPPGRGAVFGANAMVVCDAPIASAVGADILRNGGNAVDAAVAVGFALAVVYPEAGNIGGGGFALVRMGDGRTASVDYREMAPARSTRDMYVDATGKVTEASVVGPLSVGVPGAVAGLLATLDRFGSMSRQAVLAPAIRLAEEGFVVDAALSASIGDYSDLIGRFAGASVFLPNGRPLAEGTTLRQPELARTLRRIAEHGAAGFYAGETARLLVDEIRQGGGILSEADLAAYRPRWREPIRTTYRGHTVLGVSPPSSGVTLMQALNILEAFPSLPPFGSTAYTHLVASAFQRAFIDRNARLGDPDHVSVPVDRILDKGYAARLLATIDPAAATPTATVIERMGRVGLVRARTEPSETIHYSVVDRHGNAVATTTTLNNLYGSGVYVRGAGFFLNDEMDDFTSRPGVPNMFGLVQGEANAIAPGKRMLSAMSPTIVLDRDGRVLLVAGARGGPRIISSTAQVILNVIDHKMILADAMSAPRIHHQSLPDSLRVEKDGLEQAVADSLQRMGHGIFWSSGVGQVMAIMRVPGGWHGVAEPRGSGGAAGN